jgi:Holliday junction resolvase-like predicted endonuclease
LRPSSRRTVLNGRKKDGGGAVGMEELKCRLLTLNHAHVGERVFAFGTDRPSRKTANSHLPGETMKTNWHVATAAEAIAAAQFARYGYDVSVQYGANQPEYDLIITDGDRFLKVSVKGSSDGGWGLSQTQLKKIGNADYHGAADAWLQRHKPRTALCLVQFKGVGGEAMPRTYLAWPKEIAQRLKVAAGGRGDTILWEDYTRGARAAGAGTIEKIPDAWKMTPNRVQRLMIT